MPIIAGHHQFVQFDKTPNRRSDYIPTCAWPVDCLVQWGANGVVFSGNKTYRTAFFEAFPAIPKESKEPGFFRGQGRTVEDAEQDCFEKFRHSSACIHVWGRGFKIRQRLTKIKNGVERPKIHGETVYTNGGSLCRKCGVFGMYFNPVADLDKWKKIPSVLAFTSAAAGWLRPEPDDTERDLTNKRRTELRLRAVMGIDLPLISIYENKSDTRESSGSYWRACRSAIVDWYCANRNRPAGETVGQHADQASIRKFMSSTSAEIMEDMVYEELKARAAEQNGIEGIKGIEDYNRPPEV